MAVDAINNLMAFMGGMKTQGVGAAQGAQTVNKTAAVGKNPFAGANKDDGMVGIGIKDGAVQTSNGQMGKPAVQMRQLGIG